MIKLEGVSAYYGDHQVLKDIDLEINPKEILAVIGPSGCGKSTLLYTLNGLLEERGGRSTGKILLINGEERELKDMDEEEKRTLMGMVFQAPAPFPFSVEKNLRFPLKYHRVPKAEGEKKIDELLKVTGLAGEVSRKKDALTLSGGQQQRLCIARALTISPDYLLLDEPCSQLDVQNTQRIEEMLLKLKEDTGIVIVTHNLGQAKRIADRVLFLMEGRIVEIGEKDRIFEHPEKDLTKIYVSGLLG